MKYKLITIHGFVCVQTNNKKDIFKFMSGQPQYYKDKMQVHIKNNDVLWYDTFYNNNYKKEK